MSLIINCLIFSLAFKTENNMTVHMDLVQLFQVDKEVELNCIRVIRECSDFDSFNIHLKLEHRTKFKILQNVLNPTYGRQGISRLMRIVAPIPKNPAS